MRICRDFVWNPLPSCRDSTDGYYETGIDYDDSGTLDNRMGGHGENCEGANFAVKAAGIRDGR